MTAPVVDAQPLIDAISAQVNTAGVAFGEGKKPTVAAGRPYIVAFFDSGTISDKTLRSRDGFSVYGSFQCAGLTPSSVRVAVRILRTVVLGLRGTVVAGRTVLMPVHEIGRPMDRDDDADPPLHIQIEEWSFGLS